MIPRWRDHQVLIMFLWVWVLAATSLTRPKLQRLLCASKFGVVYFKVQFSIWRWFPHNMNISVNELVERSTHGDFQDSGSEGMDSQQEFPFAKMQNLSKPRQKRKPAATNVRLANQTHNPPNPLNLNSCSNKWQTRRRWMSPTPTKFLRTQFLLKQIPTKIKDGGIPEFDNPTTSIHLTEASHSLS